MSSSTSTAAEAPTNGEGQVDSSVSDLISQLPSEILDCMEGVQHDETQLTQEERDNQARSRIMEAQMRYIREHGPIELKLSTDTPVLKRGQHGIEDDDEEVSGDELSDNESLPSLDPHYLARIERIRQAKHAHTQARPGQRAAASQIFVYDESDGEDLEDDFEEPPARAKGSGKQKSRGRKRSAKTTDTSRKKTKTQDLQDNKKSKVMNLFNPTADVDNFVGQGADIFGHAQATAHLGEQPVYNGTRRREWTIKALLDSIPQDERAEARSDSKVLDEAIAYIGSRSLTSRSNQGWLLRGMKTSLKHYQVMALAFMRRQENKPIEPRGGILADAMGLGKTVEMLANIVNGIHAGREYRKAVKANNRAANAKGESQIELPPRPTLIVVPPSLLIQWEQEIRKHALVIEAGTKLRDCTPEARRWGIHGVTTCYTRDLKIQGTQSRLESHDIVLTSYYTLRKSFPQLEPPAGLRSNKEKNVWLQEQLKIAAKPLHRIRWQRVVLDEAHIIKNHQSQTSRACRALQAEFCWAMTGTPVLNALNELFPYFKFIKEPLAQSRRGFTNNFCDPHDENCTARLLTLLSTCFLRRTMSDTFFGRRLLPLPPPKTPRTMKLDFSLPERYIYDLLQRSFRKEVRQVMESEKPGKSYQQVYMKMMRLRQATDHFILLQEVMPSILDEGALAKLHQIIDVDDAQDETDARILAMILMCRDTAPASSEARHVIETPIADLQELQELVSEHPPNHRVLDVTTNYRKYFDDFAAGPVRNQISAQTLCVYCHKKPVNAHITDCDHIYCHDCLESLLHRAARLGRMSAICRECGKDFQNSQKCTAREPAPEADDNTTGQDDCEDHDKVKQTADQTMNDWLSNIDGPLTPSTKSLAMQSVVSEWLREEPDAKIIVYSQFILMLRILEEVCKTNRWTYRRYDGTMDPKRRSRAVDDFTDEKGGVQIFLSSLTCGSVGLNLNAASKVLLMESWWNESIENQAFCRVYRQGQTKTTEMTRLVVRDTIDEALEALKARKTEEIQLVLGDKINARRDKPTLTELAKLFGCEPTGAASDDIDAQDAEDGLSLDKDEEFDEQLRAAGIE